jgi:hypothetical protein
VNGPARREGNQGAAFAVRRAGAPCERHPGHAKADCVVRASPKKISREMVIDLDL